MRLTVEYGDSSDVVVISIGDRQATVRDLAAALSLTATDVIAIDGVPYDLRVLLDQVGIVDGSIVSGVETIGSRCKGRTFWVGVVNGPDSGSLVRLGAGETLSIGRHATNDLVLANTTISQHHARIHVSELGGIEVEDLGSRNGTWVGSRSLTSPTIVEARQNIRIGSSTLSIYAVDTTDRTVGMSAEDADQSGRVLFNRPPRPPIHQGCPVVTLPVPIEVRSNPTLAVVSLIAPLVFAAVMVVALGSWRYAIFGLLSPVMAVGNWLSGRRRVGRERKKDRRLHADALALLGLDLDEAERSERERRMTFGPNILELRRRIEFPARQLWERRLGVADALTVRVGLGESFWEIPTDSIAESAEVNLALESARLMREVEILVDLRDGPVGLVGDPEVAAAAARNLVLQLATHHGPADFRIAVLTTPDRVEGWTWAQWLPHCTAIDRSTHIYTGDGAHEFASWLSTGTLAQRGAPDQPAWVLVIDDVALLHGRSSPVRLALSGGESVFGLVIAPTEDALPASVSTVVEVGPVDGIFSLREPSIRAGESAGVLDLVSFDIANELSRSMSLYEDPEVAQVGGTLPRLVTGDDLFGAALGVDAIRRRWRTNADRSTLETALGVASTGVFAIDLVADGPHALVAGTTGSGKSELLRTFIVGLAMNHDPSQVVFVLIDYKGGSAFDRCAELPHVVGVVTDLDDHLAERALRSLEAELRYREEQLRSAGAENIDMYRSSRVGQAPLPRLVVIIDEFATLRNELPGFVDSLVAIAQRGRSLGVHLVLATQRPSGSVDANIRANTNLRIALRVQNGSDSTDVIESSVAANISRALPGRAYVRRGDGDLVAVQTGFVSGQAGSASEAVRVGRPVIGRGEVPVFADEALFTKQLLEPTELDGFVIALVDSAADIPNARRPWLDDLPPVVSSMDVEGLPTLAGEEEPITIALGDDPANQRRVTRKWDPSVGHLAAIGVPGSGVSTAIRSLIAALGMADLDRDVWVFAVDHAGGALSGVGSWPHVACCLDPTERERHDRLLSFLDGELARRQALSSSECEGEPLLVVAIDGVSAFLESVGSDVGTPTADLVNRLGRDGPTFGIVLLIGATRSDDLPRTLRSQVRRHLLFEQADPNDFATLGIRPKNLPAFVPGRALLSPDGMVCQVVDWEGAFQANEISLKGFPPVIEALETQIDSTRLSPASVGPVLTIPIGLLDATRTPARLSLRPGEHATVAGPAGSGRTNALCLVAAQLRGVSSDIVLVGVASQDDSALLDSSVLDAGGPLADIEHVLRMAFDDDRRWVILIDDADRIDIGDGPLVEMSRRSPPNVTMIAAIRSAGGQTAYGHWTRAIRGSGIGLLLMPEGVNDGELLGARLPRASRLEAVPGRGYLIAAGKVEAMQLALV